MNVSEEIAKHHHVLAEVEQSALACMAKVSFTPTNLMLLIAGVLIVGIAIGWLSAKFFKR